MYKIIVKALNKRRVGYLESKQIISGLHQFGFRKHKSTVDAVLNLVANVVESLDRKEKSLEIFLDLSKAFNTVSISILLTKLKKIGVRGVTLELFRDYLSNRTQTVKIGDYISSEQTLEYGVPQGSILGPTLFIIYINDLCELFSTNCSVYTYADDTALLINGHTWDEAKQYAETALKYVVHWLSTNPLTLYIKKTSFITFVHKTNMLPPDTYLVKAHTCIDSPINCDCVSIMRNSHIKYLGVYIDQFLKWQHHIDIVTSRVRKIIHVFKQLRNAADFKTLLMTYYALAQSIIPYCITAWGGAA